MSAEAYFTKGLELIREIRGSQAESISNAARLMAGSIQSGGWVYLFGSGHSVLPVMDVFPRYGSYIGFRPLMDPRLMWFNVTGPGGAPELLWIERQEGYISNFLKHYNFEKLDTLLVYSHGGLNAASIEAAQYVKQAGSSVVAVTSMDNYRNAEPKHSSGNKLADLADVVIDNCVPLEDSLVDVGQLEKVAAGSTVSVILISMALVAETAALLKQRGYHLMTFVSPNVPGVAPDHNERVFEVYNERIRTKR